MIAHFLNTTKAYIVSLRLVNLSLAYFIIVLVICFLVLNSLVTYF